MAQKKIIILVFNLNAVQYFSYWFFILFFLNELRKKIKIVNKSQNNNNI